MQTAVHFNCFCHYNTHCRFSLLADTVRLINSHIIINSLLRPFCSYFDTNSKVFMPIKLLIVLQFNGV